MPLHIENVKHYELLILHCVMQSGKCIKNMVNHGGR